MFSYFGKEMWSFLCFFPFNNNHNDQSDTITPTSPYPRLYLDIFGCECLKEIQEESNSETGSERGSESEWDGREIELKRTSGGGCVCPVRNGCVARTERTYLILFSGFALLILFK